MDVIPVSDDIVTPNVANTIIPYLYNEIHKHKDHLTWLFWGKPNIGKTSAAIWCASLLDPDFTAERITFSVDQYINLTRSGLKPGSVILFDEAGKSLGARNFMERQQRDFMVFFQASRVLQLATLITLPGASMLDKQMRMLLHIDTEVFAKLDKEQLTKGRMKFNSFKLNWKTNLPMYNYPAIHWHDQTHIVKEVCFHKPEKKIFKEYTAMKLDNLMKLQAGILSSKEVKKEMADNQQTDLTPYVQKILLEKKMFESSKVGRYNSKIIKTIFPNLTYAQCETVKKLAETSKATP